MGNSPTHELWNSNVMDYVIVGNMYCIFEIFIAVSLKKSMSIIYLGISPENCPHPDKHFTGNKQKF